MQRKIEFFVPQRWNFRAHLTPCASFADRPRIIPFPAFHDALWGVFIRGVVISPWWGMDGFGLVCSHLSFSPTVSSVPQLVPSLYSTCSSSWACVLYIHAHISMFFVDYFISLLSFFDCSSFFLSSSTPWLTHPTSSIISPLLQHPRTTVLHYNIHDSQRCCLVPLLFWLWQWHFWVTSPHPRSSIWLSPPNNIIFSALTNTGKCHNSELVQWGLFDGGGVVFIFCHLPPLSFFLPRPLLIPCHHV